jgi:hypothetical protein
MADQMTFFRLLRDLTEKIKKNATPISMSPHITYQLSPNISYHVPLCIQKREFSPEKIGFLNQPSLREDLPETELSFIIEKMVILANNLKDDELSSFVRNLFLGENAKSIRNYDFGF